MARIRTIKPHFFKHEALFDAEKATGLPLRVSFSGLWTTCDREGRFEWRPRQLKLDCLPYDEVDFSRVLDALATRGFIVRYRSTDENGAHDYGFIPSWRKHQVINPRERASELPSPDDCEIIQYDDDASSTREPRDTKTHVHAHGEGEGEGEKEREGEQEKKQKRASALNGDGYAFSGKVIRLNNRDFQAWKEAYEHLSLRAELIARDAWLADQPASNKKTWFQSTASYLAKKNREARTERAKAALAPDVEMYRGSDGELRPTNRG